MRERHVSWIGYEAATPDIRGNLRELGFVVDESIDASSGLAQVIEGSPVAVFVGHSILPGEGQAIPRTLRYKSGSQIAVYTVERIFDLDRRIPVFILAPKEVDPSDYIIAGATALINTSTISIDKFLQLLKRHFCLFFYARVI